MKNKIMLSLMAFFTLATASNVRATKFVDVATLGDGVSVATSSGTVKVNATVLSKNQRWTRDRVYILANNVIVPNGVTLTIEAGTLIRGEYPTIGQGVGAEAALTPADPGALVVARGGRLIAKGTADSPIIFTSFDDVNVPGGIETVPPVENIGVTGTPGSLRVTTNTVVTVTNGVTNTTTYLTTNTIAGVQKTYRTGGAYVGSTNTNGSPNYAGEYSYSGGALTTTARDYSTTWKTNGCAFKYDGLWGGIVLAGKMTVNTGYSSGVNAVSGTGSGTVEPTINSTTGAVGTAAGCTIIEGMAGFYPYSFGGGDGPDGNNPNTPDDSGCLAFVQNRYGGYVIAKDKELNSYSFYGVGRGTVCEYLEAINNADDDYEFWGGDLSTRHCVSEFSGDDGHDTDMAYLGTCQNFVMIQNDGIGTDGTSLSGRAPVNYGDNLIENDGPEGNNSAVPYTRFTMANATLIGRGYGVSSYGQDAANFNDASAKVPFAGPCFRENGAGLIYNTIVMDAPHGPVAIVDLLGPTDNTYTSAGNSSVNRFVGIRTNGGFDAAGRASDLTTPDNSAQSGPDGGFYNTWFYRNGYAKNASLSDGTRGVYANMAEFNAAYSSNNLPPFNTNNLTFMTKLKSRWEAGGDTAQATPYRVTPQCVIDVLTNANTGNQFNSNPGLTVSPFHRISGMDLRVTAAGARDVTNGVAMPNYRGLNSDLTYVGAVRDNMWMKGWTYGDQLGIYSGVQIDPEVLISVDQYNHAKVTYAATSGVWYTIERSTDNKSFTTIATIKNATDGNNDYIDDTASVGSNPTFYRVVAQ
jgi:hypothetical protein